MSDVERKAWACPRCDAVNAPHVDRCACVKAMPVGFVPASTPVYIPVIVPVTVPYTGPGWTDFTITCAELSGVAPLTVGDTSGYLRCVS